MIHPCDGLSFEDRVARLASWLRPRTNFAGHMHRDFERGKVGVCQLCDSPLPVAVRAMRYIGNDKFETRECKPDSPELAAYLALDEARKDKLKALGWYFCELAACTSIADERVWNAAQTTNLRHRQELLATAEAKTKPSRSVRERAHNY